MEVSVISRDHEFCELCREVLGELANPFTLRRAEPDAVPAGADLYIWDFEPDQSFPDQFRGPAPSRHLFLVNRKDLNLFHERRAVIDPVVLLKPATRVTLSAFLGQSLGSLATAGPRPDVLRASCDELLGCLIRTNLKLQEYDQERTNFLARAVHDFRAPLTALSGYCGLLLAEPLGALNDDQKEVLKRMEHSAKRLSRMASAMFQLSIGGHVKFQPHLEKADLQECLDQTLHELAPFIEEKRLTVSVNILSAPTSLYFDRNQMEQALLNLLDNACKFTPKGGRIDVTGYSFFWDRRSHQPLAPRDMTERRIQECRAPNSFRIDIHDSGPGIPLEHLKSIFEEYTRYAGTQDRTGGGLGLAICKLILNGHRGRVWAESSESGSTFSLVIPFNSAGHARLVPEEAYAVA